MAPEGLHSKSLSIFIDCTLRFDCTVYVECKERRSNARSLLGMLALSVMSGDDIKLIAEGPEEDIAMEKLVELVQTNFINKELIEEIRNRR